MKLFSQSLMSDLENQLKGIHSQSDEPVHYAEQALKKLITTLEKLKTALINHTFQNKLDEIDFFKNIKPQFTSKLILYNDIYNIEINKPFSSKKAIRKYYYSELAKLETYFIENLDFYKYYRTGNSSLDYKYFVRGKYDLRHTLDSFYLLADHRFSTSHDYKVAGILANDSIKIYLEVEISKLENTTLVPFRKTQKWTGSRVALVELIYALHAEGVFNNGTAELKEVVTVFESAFNIELGQFNRAFLEIRSRKSERTKFLNTLKEKLILRMDNADEI